MNSDATLVSNCSVVKRPFQSYLFFFFFCHQPRLRAADRVVCCSLPWVYIPKEIASSALSERRTQSAFCVLGAHSRVFFFFSEIAWVHSNLPQSLCRCSREVLEVVRGPKPRRAAFESGAKCGIRSGIKGGEEISYVSL